MICIVIPCYNEEHRLPVSELLAFSAAEPGIRFCLVDDGSNDGTAGILTKLAEEHPQFRALLLPANQGKAEAVRQGVLKVLEDPAISLVAFLDADLATPPEEMIFLASHFKPELVFVFGSRILKVGSVISRKAYRHYFGRIIATLISWILKLEVYDTQCGAKLFRKETAAVLFRDKFISRWLFDVEIFARLISNYSQRTSTVMLEVPLRTWIEKGDSKITFADLLKIPLELLKIRMAYRRK